MAKTKRSYGEFKCKLCSKVFSERAGLAQHIQLHNTDRPFSCHMCTYTCKTKKYLHRHQARVHSEATGNECGVCGKKFHFKCNLEKHMFVHTNERPYKCEVCNKGFNAMYSLRTHRHLHTGAKPFKCSYCDYACRDSSTLRKHKERHTGVTRVFQCTQCDKSYKTKRTLKIHVAEVHLQRDVKTLPCEHCGKLFKTLKHLNNHVRQTHLRLFSCQCEICGATLASKYNMITHLTSHIDYRPFACNFEGCEKRYKDKQSLKKHTIVHYPERQFPCDVCNRMFTRLRRMEAHRKQHAIKRKSVFCDHCGKGFYNKNYVRSHITRKHMYRQHYICDVCGLLTYNKPSIVMHLKYGHVSDMDRKCKICKKTYKKHAYLKSHYWKTHSVRYKINYNRCRRRKIINIDETTEKNSKTNTELEHEIKVEPLSESEETSEHPVATSEGASGGVASATAVQFADFIERIIMPSAMGDEGLIEKETDIYVDVRSQKEADRVRDEMLRRWRMNGGTKPLKRLERHYNGPPSKRDFNKVNEKIEITVFNEIESTVPISEYKRKRLYFKDNNTNNTNEETTPVTDKRANRHTEKNNNENNTINETDNKINVHNTERENIDKNEQISSKDGSMHIDDRVRINNESLANDRISDDVIKTEPDDNILNDDQERNETELNTETCNDIGYGNSLAELVKVRKRRCVRNTIQNSYNDVDDDHYTIIGKGKISTENGVNFTGTNNGDIRIENSKELVDKKRKTPGNPKRKRNNKKKRNISKTRISKASKTSDRLEKDSRENDKICDETTENYERITNSNPLENDVTNSRENYEKINETRENDQSITITYPLENDQVNSGENYEISNTTAENYDNIRNSTPLENDPSNRRENYEKGNETTENDETITNDVLINDVDTHIAGNDHLEFNKTKPAIESINKNKSKNKTFDGISLIENDKTFENQSSSVADINIENFENTDTNRPRRSFRNIKKKVNNDFNSHNDSEDDDDDDEFVPNDDDDDDDDGSDEEINKSSKFKINTHQCYVCFKLYETKEKLLDHCKEHFDVCNMKMLKKCPLCDFVTKADLVRHVKLTHKINLNYLYGTLKDRKNNNEKSRFYFNAKNENFNEIEVIPSIKNLNRQAFLKIDRKRREKNYREVKKAKLVKKDGEWIVEKELINTKKGNYVLPDKVVETLKDDESKEKELEKDDYCVKMQKLYKIAKKNGQKMLFPCEKCEKICQTLSALKLHIRRHDPNAKPYKKKVWKHKLSEEELKKLQEDKEKSQNKIAKSKNRYQKPKPIIHKHKCDPKLKEFYRKNIKGGDIEFWQFLKIFNKMTRDNINDFKDLENRTEFGIHFIDPELNPPKETIDSNPKSDLNSNLAKTGLKAKKINSKIGHSNPKSDLNPNLAKKSKTNKMKSKMGRISETKVVNKVIENRYKRKILISKKDYLERKRMKELLRQKIADKCNK